MRSSRVIVGLLVAVVLALAEDPAVAASQTDQARAAERAGELSMALGLYVKAIAKTSAGGAAERRLQKSAIAAAQKLRQPPNPPEAVYRHMARGEAFVETAKSKSGFERAIREFRTVTRVAPWLSQPYYNLGIMQEKAGYFDAAMDSLRMYLTAAPNASDARKVRTEIYKMEARKEAAAAQAADRRKREQARVRVRQEARRREELENLERLSGRYYNPAVHVAPWIIQINGNRFRAYIQGESKRILMYDLRIEGARLVGSTSGRRCPRPVPVSGSIDKIRGTIKPTFPIYHPNSWKSYHFPTAKGTVSPMQPGTIFCPG